VCPDGVVKAPYAPIYGINYSLPQCAARVVYKKVDIDLSRIEKVMKFLFLN
jgi:hypothetical protein